MLDVFMHRNSLYENVRETHIFGVFMQEVSLRDHERDIPYVQIRDLVNYVSMQNFGGTKD